jgi:hypothetical protein
MRPSKAETERRAHMVGPATLAERVQAVKAHALKNYEQGWDTVVECYDTVEIEEVVRTAKTIKGAIWLMSRHIGPGNAYRQEIERTAF